MYMMSYCQKGRETGKAKPCGMMIQLPRQAIICVSLGFVPLRGKLMLPQKMHLLLRIASVKVLGL